MGAMSFGSASSVYNLDTRTQNRGDSLRNIGRNEMGQVDVAGLYTSHLLQFGYKVR